MNKEEKEKAAMQEWNEALEESRREENAMMAKLKSEGRYIGGLDTDRESFCLITQKLNRRLKEIQEKYK